MNEIPEQEREHLAVIGMSGRFPGASSVQELWTKLRTGTECITFFSREQLERAGVPVEQLEDPAYVPARGVLTEIEGFDAGLFGLTPNEAAIMDPQQRLFLECAWEAMENAGYPTEAAGQRAGIFAGSAEGLYRFYNVMAAGGELAGRVGNMAAGLLNDRDLLPMQVSYRLGLTGPSVSVQSACSTSLLAVHLAGQALLSGECDLALAGGVALNLPQETGYLYEEGGILSPDGHCRPFDARAQGTLSGSGVGVVVLKRLSDALADGDAIRAVILGTATGNDGSGRVGFTAPGVEGQMTTVAEALEVAGVDPRTIGYVETHGSATPLGDPIEVSALSGAFQAISPEPRSRERGWCAIGSVKSNLGHLDEAAGVAGLIKTILALEHGEIPPSLNFAEPNPQIDFAASPFYVNTELRPWPADLRRAGVSSFGLGGTNVHLVLEEAPRQTAAPSYRPCHLVVWSAQTESAAEAAGTRLLEHLRSLAEDPEAPQHLGDVAYTSQVGRRALRHRRALVCCGDDPAAAAQRLENGAVVASEAAEPPVLAFLLPGLGDHHPGMLAQLYSTEKILREEVDRCAEILLPILNLDLREVLFPEELPAPAAEPDLRQMLRRGGGDRQLGELARTAVAHPALFVVEYALARQLMAWGLVPEALVGYSLGELVAACLAEVLDLESALRLVAERARLVQGLPGGAMLAVPLAEDALVPRLTGEVALAATDGPHLSVVAGPEDAVAALAAGLEEDGVACLRLHAGHAFHSPMMEPAADALTRMAATLELKPPRIPYLSNVSGTWITDREATDPAYWARHLTSPVRFWESLGELLEEPRRALLEVGPGESLAALARQHSAFTARHRAVSAVGRPRPGAELEPLLQALGQLWAGGLALDWQAFYSGGGRRVPLPTYPFERHRHWIDAQLGAAVVTPGTGSQEWLAGKLEGDPGAEARRQPVERWLWHPVWRQAPLGAAPLDRAPADGESWLIFLDDEGLGQSIAQRLEAAGERVTTVTPSDAFGLPEEGAYTLDPARRQDYAALWRELCRSSDPPRHLLHLWAVGGASDFDGERRRGLGSVLFLAQTLGQAAGEPAPRITVVTTGVADVVGGEVGVPARGAVAGACRVIGQELPGIVCRTVDLELPTRGLDSASAARWWDRAAGQVLTEALAPEVPGRTAASQIAYRGGRRWQQGFDLADDVLPSPKQLEPGSGEGWRLAGGRYLITGSGELALAMAEAVAAAQDGRRGRLALAVEEDLPPRESWQGLIEERPEAPGTHGRFRRLLALEARLEELVLVRWRQPTAEDTRRLVAEVRRRLGGLDGVIHAGGRAPDGLLQLKPAGPLTGFDGLLGRGARELLEALELGPAAGATAAGVPAASPPAPPPLDFVVLCSNSAPLVGGLGQLDRCASSTFLAALAEAGAARAWQRGEDTLVTAVEWSPFVWESPESAGTGLGGLEERRRRDTERFGIRADEAGQVLMRILAARPAQPSPRVVVSPRNLLQHMRAAQGITAESLFRELGATHQEGEGENRRQGLSSDLVAPRSDLERSLTQVWEEMFGIERIGVQDNFFELGGHSLLAIQVVTRMREVTGFDLPMTVLFDAPTVEQLAALVMGQEVESLDDEEMTGFAELFEQVEEMDPEEVQRLLSDAQG